MTTPAPDPLLLSLLNPRYLLTSWPWRAATYLIASWPTSFAASLGFLVVSIPLLIVLGALRQERPIDTLPLVFFAIISIAVIGTSPLTSYPMVAYERWRLGIVRHRIVAQDGYRGLGARFSTGQAWREVAYAVWLGTGVPICFGLLSLFVTMQFALLVSPWAAMETSQVAIAWAVVESPAGAIPFAIVGLFLLPVLGYLIGVIALIHASVARWLLNPGDQAALQEVARSRTRLVDAYEGERMRIERDFHDVVQPRLTSLALQIGLARLDVPDDSAAARPLARAHDQATSLMILVNEVAQGIRPQALAELGLVQSVRELAANSTIPISVHADSNRSFPEAIETTAYFVISEALGNVDRHSDARQAQVRIITTGSGLVVEIEDDGRGGADPQHGSGLVGLADRVATRGGRLMISSPSGGPTVVHMELPCEN